MVKHKLLWLLGINCMITTVGLLYSYIAIDLASILFTGFWLVSSVIITATLFLSKLLTPFLLAFKNQSDETDVESSATV